MPVVWPRWLYGVSAFKESQQGCYDALMRADFGRAKHPRPTTE